MIRRPPRSPLFPSPPLSRSAENQPAHQKTLSVARAAGCSENRPATERLHHAGGSISGGERRRVTYRRSGSSFRSEEHTSELQSHLNLVCRLLLEKKKQKQRYTSRHGSGTLGTLRASNSLPHLGCKDRRSASICPPCEAQRWWLHCQ